MSDRYFVIFPTKTPSHPASDDSYSGTGSSEESGKDWSDLEEEARRDDQRRIREERDEDSPKKKRKIAPPPKSKSSSKKKKRG